MIRKHIAFCLILLLVASYSLSVSAQTLVPVTQGTDGLSDSEGDAPSFDIDDLLGKTKPKSIIFPTVSITEETEGFWIETEGRKYYYYDWQQYLQCRVVFSNGRVEYFSGPQFTYLGKKYTLSFTDPQSVEDPWVAGNTYSIPISVGEVSGTMTIVIKRRGDCNGDGYVNNEDVIYLLWHTLFEEDYPLSCSGDVNGDGHVNNEDVIYLLWHTLFEEDYPLAR